MRIRAAGIEDVQGIARVHVDSWRTTYAGMISDEFLANLSYSRREELWKQNMNLEDFCLFVAEDSEHGIVGFISGVVISDSNQPYRAELTALYLLQEVQGQGLGRALVLELFRAFEKQGLNSVHVWVLYDNAAKQFYEHLGAILTDDTEIEIGGSRLRESGLGWDSQALKELLASAE